MQHFPADFYVQDEHTICLQGDWKLATIQPVLAKLTHFTAPASHVLTIAGNAIRTLDTAGALALLAWADTLKKSGVAIHYDAWDPQHRHFLDTVEQHYIQTRTAEAPSDKLPPLAALGQETVHKWYQAAGLFALIGDVSIRLYQAVLHARRFHYKSIAANIYHTGITALPIVGTLSFLIGIVLAYQMGLQLQTYGANSFIAFLTGMAIFREFGPLITAIIVAGRTSSAFTAQLGSMKVNEEIDALQTMGLSPTEYLVLPKVLGLLLVFPLLIFWSNTFSVLGAMWMSYSQLDIHYVDFLTRLKASVGLKQLLLGLYKAPVFAILIAIVGCFQGFAVTGSSENIGLQTTKSVVQALFLIIVADAAFSVIYSWIGV